jgi:hypothetical protein
MWISSIFEGVNVGLDGFNLNSFYNSSFFKDFWIVDSLGSRDDFLTSHENIIRIGKDRVILVKHGIERSCRNWVLMKDVKICLIFFLDNLSEFFFDISRDVLGRVLVDSILFK